MQLHMRSIMELKKIISLSSIVVILGMAMPGFAGDTVGLPAPTSEAAGAFPGQRTWQKPG